MSGARWLVRVAALAVLLVAAAPAAAAPFTVTTTTDSDDGACTPTLCSLRDAVTAANVDATADVITVPAGHYTLTNPAGELAITHDVTIAGAGASATIIDGNLAHRVFNVTAPNTNLTLSGLTVTRGKDIQGAAVFSVGSSLILDGVDVTDNNGTNPTPGSSGFGAIFANVTGAFGMTIANSTISGNVSGGNGGGGYGTVALSPSTNLTLNITNSRVTSNRDGGDGTTGAFGEPIFRLDASGTTTVNVTNSVFANNKNGGSGPNSAGYGVLGLYGGMSLNATITNSTFAGNTSGGGATNSGGIGPVYAVGTGSLTVVGSTFSGNTTGGGNTSGLGGGVYFTPGSGTSTVDLVNSTFTGNSVGGGGLAGTGSGGGIYIEPTGGATATATLNNVTVVGNSVGGGGGTGLGGGLFVNSAVTTKVLNSIIADNVSGGGPANCSMGVTSLGHNIENAASCAFTGPGDQIVEPLLGTLGDYGGPTQTIPPLPGSPAIDHGAGCAPTDQRGLPRPFGAACDVGAYEYAPPVPTTGAATSVTLTSAVLGGQVSPNIRTANFHFEYGRTSSYGSATANQTGGGLGSLPVSAKVTGLTPGTTYHYRLVASGDNTSLGADRTFTTTLASLSRLKLSPTKFPAAPRGGSVAKKKRKTGTNITYTASDTSTTTFRVLKPTPGRRQGKSCRKPSSRNRRGKKCTRYVALPGSFTHKDQAGRNKLHFTGRLRRHKLRPGKYRLSATPKAGGKNGRTRNVSFKIIR